MADLSMKIAGISFKNPVCVSSGTCGYGRELNEFYDISRLGGIFAKGTTITPRPGNPLPRIAETPSGLINAVGLENPGIDAVIARELPWLIQHNLCVCLNIAGNTPDEYARMCEKLDRVPGLSGIELNISCPNVSSGLAFGSTPEGAYEVVSACRKQTSLPLFVKLTPNVTDISVIVQAVEEAKADVLTVMNTLVGMVIDIERQRPLLGNTMGGLCGPATLPVALWMVYQVAQMTQLPIVGVGGIASVEDAVAFFMAGASAVAVGTGNLVTPMLTMELIDGISNWLDRHNYENLQQIIGAALPKKAHPSVSNGQRHGKQEES